MCRLVIVQLLGHVRLSATSWTVAHPAPLSMGFSRQRYWNGLPCPCPVDLPNPGIEPASPASGGRFFTTEPPGKPDAQVVVLIPMCVLAFLLCDLGYRTCLVTPEEHEGKAQLPVLFSSIPPV